MTRYATVADSDVEPKTKAGAVGGFGGAGVVGPFVLWALAALFWHGDMQAIPWQVSGFVLALISGACAFGASWLAKHVNRPSAEPATPSAAASVAPLDPTEKWMAELKMDKTDTGWTTRRDSAEPVLDLSKQSTRKHIPEDVIPGKRLGRHVNHDPRSLLFKVPETATPTTVFWDRKVPVFDQGNLGSCTGNAAAGVLGTSPFYETLPSGFLDDENEAVALYSEATKLDGYSGSYPPDDTGSDGLSVAKAAQKAGLISAYQHITSIGGAHTAIQAGPFITGVNWYSSMDNPTRDGLVVVSGTVRGGHEFVCHGYDAGKDLWWFTNSWGTGWGANGRFCMSTASFSRLLSEQGDATTFLPVTAPTPPPAPTPTPTPVLNLPADVVAWAQRTVDQPWQSHRDRKAAQELLDLLAGK